MSRGKHVIGVCIIVVPVMVMSLMMAGGGAADKGAGDTAGVPDSVPAQYKEAVSRAGSLCPEISPAIIAAQVQKESSWDPLATSPVGAQGIAQFMPATWQSAGRDGDGDGKAEVWNPKDAIFSQGHFMCSMVEEVRGFANGTDELVRFALAAYNAGPAAVQEARGVPPFPETQKYVQSITSMASQMATASGSGGDAGGGGDRGSRIVATARSKIGLPYVWGAEGPDSYDCSGLVLEAYKSVGVTLVHSSAVQCASGTRVSQDQAQPGDLVCWSGHVAIYAGGGSIVEAATFGIPVRETQVYDMPGGPYYVRIDG